MVRIRIGVGLLLLVAGCTPMPDPWAKAKAGQKRVLTSFPPIYCLTKEIAGDDAYVMCLLTTKGPHSYQESQADSIKLTKAELVLVNGLGLDEVFMKKMFNGSGNKSKNFVNLGDKLWEFDKKLLLEGQMHGDHHHGDFDPHVWLGPPETKILVKSITEALCQLDPSHKAGFEQRAGKLDQKLDQLLEEGRAMFKDKKNRNILSMHESLGYFARAFGLEVVASVQQQPGVDPDAVRLADLVKKCKAKDVHVIAVEPQYHQGLPNTLKRNLESAGHELRVVEIDPLETAQPTSDGNPDADFYFSTMRKNLENLAKALP